jgi:23S rRNA (pseudouridine1915-N3)-methyltransferase
LFGGADEELNMKVTILAIGKCKHSSPEAQIIAEYVKRSGWDIIIKEKDNSTREDEGKFLQSSIPSGAKVIVLDERGVNIKSMELAQKIEKWIVDGCSEICFLIGGADGHLQSTRDMADLVLSFGQLTLPHILMRAVLSEQIYRLQTIINHHPYHRE